MHQAHTMLTTASTRGALHPPPHSSAGSSSRSQAFCFRTLPCKVVVCNAALHGSCNRSAATVAAAAVFDAPQTRPDLAAEGITTSASIAEVNPSVWLEDISDEIEQATAALTADSNNHSSNASLRNHQGHYLGVYEPHSSGNHHSRAAPHDASSNSSRSAYKSNRRPSRRAKGKLIKLYASIQEQHEAEYTAWLHEQEQEYLQLLASGASAQQLQQQELKQQRQAQHLTSRWQQQWGPPVDRTQVLDARGSHWQQKQQQQRQQHVFNWQSSSSSNNNNNKVPGSQRQLHTTAGRTSRGSGSSSRMPVEQTQAKQQHVPQSPVFDIPDDTPELAAAAAAAMEESAAVQRFTNHHVGAHQIAAAIAKEPIDTDKLDSMEIVFLHLALPKLNEMKLMHLLPKLADYVLSRPDKNQHTCGAVFNAYALANRLDLALATWNQLAAAGVDIGPFGSSALIKACARQRNVAAALQVFDQLLRRRVTFNAYTYNCLLQLCASAGRMDDALAVYNLQRLETEPANLPDSYTYNALMRGVLVAGRVELTQQLFENMLEDGVSADPPLYCNYLNAAGRAGNLGLARYLYQHMLLSLNLPHPAAAARSSSSSSGSNSDQGLEGLEWQQQHQIANSSSAEASSSVLVPNMLTIVNALLFAHAQVGAFQSALAVYQQELLGRSLRPDAYTCTALLTAASRVSNMQLSWADVQYVVDTMQQYHIGLTTQLGTALINAYRRVQAWERSEEQQARGSRSSDGSSNQPKQKQKRRGKRIPAVADGCGMSNSEADVQSAAEVALEQEQQQLAAIGAVSLPGVRPVVSAALHAARQVLQHLQDAKMATSNSYVTMMCFMLEQGQYVSFRQLFNVMAQQHIVPDEQGWERLMLSSEECGMQDAVKQMKQQFEAQQQAPVQEQWQQQPRLQRAR